MTSETNAAIHKQLVNDNLTVIPIYTDKHFYVSDYQHLIRYHQPEN